MPAAESIAISVSTAPSRWVGQTEMCEHKGVGHPDSLCDGAVEAAAHALCRAYLDDYGAIQHFNLDKALLIGGMSEPKFGGGQLLRPMRLVVSGPVTELPAVNAGQIVERAIRDYLVSCLGSAGDDIRIEPILRPSAPNLRRVTGTRVPLSNDTSFGVGYAPLSSLEKAVLSAARLLRSSEFMTAFPAAGNDFKVMGSRLGGNHRLTIALAFVDRFVHETGEYFAKKSQIGSYLIERIPEPSVEIAINTLDDSHAIDESGIYLTVTGLSAEHGDDGQVGRGNRVNGLITPYRPMSLEAAAGKNPAAHVGKLYNVLAHRLAGLIATEVAGVNEVVVRLLSGIGRPINQPQLTAIDVVAEQGLSPAQQQEIRELLGQQLANLPKLAKELATGTIPVF